MGTCRGGASGLCIAAVFAAADAVTRDYLAIGTFVFPGSIAVGLLPRGLFGGGYAPPQDSQRDLGVREGLLQLVDRLAADLGEAEVDLLELLQAVQMLEAIVGDGGVGQHQRVEVRQPGQVR